MANVLLIDPAGALVSFGLHCIEEGHAVKQWIRPHNGEQSKIARGLIDRVTNWQVHMKWADIVVLSDNAYEMRDLERYNEEGYPIFGTNMLGAKLELDRDYGMDVMKKAGLSVMPSHEFKDYNSAIEFVKANPKRYVSKPSGDADKALSYVSSSAADMVFMLERWKAKGKNKLDFILQEFVPGIEVAVGGWIGPNGFTKNVLENWEHKKLMPGNYGCQTGEMGCYSSDTEVLTDGGWKFWPDVTKDDKLATLVDGKTTFETPTELVEFDVDGEMIQWKNRSIDILVTPNHNMYVAGQKSARDKNPKWKFVQAENCTESQYLLNRTAGWDGESPENFVCPGANWHTGIGPRSTDDLIVQFNTWCKFLGIYFAEGSTSGGQVQIAQSHPEKSKKVKELLSDFPIEAKQHGNGFVINCSAVARVTKPFGRSYEKRIPKYIKNASSKDISDFLDAFCLGDGHVQANGSRIFYTSNPGLADDLQELMLKCGRLGIVKRLKRKNNMPKINGRTIYQRRDAFAIYERAKKITGWLDARDRETVHYKGKVYCATVSSHVLFVRRNGKPVWCGNTVIRYISESKLFDETLSRFEDYLAMIGHVGYVDLAFIIDEKGEPRPLEWTTRPGWPLFNIQMNLHKGSQVKWMMDLLEGKDTLKVSHDICTGIVIPIGDYPKSKTTGRDHSGFPVYGLDDNPQLHLCEVMKGKGPHMVDGEVKEIECLVTAGDYVAVACGLGDTVKEACENAYALVKEIDIPESINVRDDVGERCEKQIPELQEFGFMTDWEYK